MELGFSPIIQGMRDCYVNEQPYNYSVFDVSPNEFIEFAKHAPKATMRAPSFPVEDLATGQTIELSSLWKETIVVMEFGSFT
jgi:hypothetical protein